MIVSYKMKGWNGWSPLKQNDDEKKCYINDEGKKVCPMKLPDPKEFVKTIKKKSSKKPDTKKFKDDK